MRLVFAFLAIALASATATAEPCAVRIARAPDEVRAVIETWIRAEPRCATALEVRVVATDGGYYLHARDVTGRVHERIVPDAQAAGVLVASWAAADAPAAPVGTRLIGIPIPRSSEAPGAVSAVSPERPDRGLGIDAVAALNLGSVALRGEAELRSGGGWLLYLGASYGQAVVHWEDGGSTSPFALHPHDTRVMAGVGHVWGRGAWQLRARIGLVGAWWHADFSDSSMTDTIDTRFFGFESDLRADRRLDDRWSLTMGLAGSTFVDHSTQPTAAVLWGPAFDAGLVGGLHARI